METFVSEKEVHKLVQNTPEAALYQLLFQNESRTDLICHVIGCDACDGKVFAQINPKDGEICRALAAMPVKNAIELLQSQLCPPAYSLHSMHCKTCTDRIESLETKQAKDEFARLPPEEQARLQQKALRWSRRTKVIPISGN